MSNRRNELAPLEAACKALGDATRLRIAHLLQEGEVCVCHVHEALGLSQPKVSRHLAYLRRAGLVSTRRQGRWIYYQWSGDASPLQRPLLAAIVKMLRAAPSCAEDRRRLEEATACQAPPVPGDGGRDTRRAVPRRRR